MPSLLLFLLGLCMWLNFQQKGTDPMFLYWPVLLIGLTICILFFPAPILYHRSREWWAYSNVSSPGPYSTRPANSPKFRLLLAGLYPVEFRDFFLGDMYCSLTYSMGVSFSNMRTITSLMTSLESGAVFLSICEWLE